MKLIRRGVGQAIRIQPDFDLDPGMPIGELFINGPIQVVLCQADNGVAKLAIFSDARILVVEDEAVYEALEALDT